MTIFQASDACQSGMVVNRLFSMPFSKTPGVLISDNQLSSGDLVRVFGKDSTASKVNDPLLSAIPPLAAASHRFVERAYIKGSPVNGVWEESNFSLVVGRNEGARAITGIVFTTADKKNDEEREDATNPAGGCWSICQTATLARMLVNTGECGPTYMANFPMPI